MEIEHRKLDRTGPGAETFVLRVGRLFEHRKLFAGNDLSLAILISERFIERKYLFTRQPFSRPAGREPVYAGGLTPEKWASRL